MKRLLAFVLSVCLALGISAGTFAASKKDAPKLEKGTNFADIINFMTGEKVSNKDVEKFFKEADIDEDKLIEILGILFAEDEDDTFEEVELDDLLAFCEFVYFLFGDKDLEDLDKADFDIEEIIDAVGILAYFYDNEDLKELFEDIDLEEALELIEIVDYLFDGEDWEDWDENYFEGIDLEEAIKAIEILSYLFDEKELDTDDFEGYGLEEALGIIEVVSYLFDEEDLDEDDFEGYDLEKALEASILAYLFGNEEYDNSNQSPI